MTPLRESEAAGPGTAATLGFGAAIVQIILLDFAFSLDSIITAVGMTDDLPIMIVAVLVAVTTMLLAQTRWRTSSTGTRAS